MSTGYVLMEYYIRYLRDVRELSESSIKHYQDALRNISKLLVKQNKIEQTIYEISDIGELEILRAYLYNNPEFVDQDKRGHQMYSAGLNNYLRFANGKGFAKIRDRLYMLDVEIPVGDKNTKYHTVWKRSGIIKNQSIEIADYLCEINTKHETFTAESTNHPYMEGHHAIPMHLQTKFSNSLDVYANIVCLCPICHRLLHYGVKNDKLKLLNQIYENRSDRLASSGIRINKDDFVKMVV